MAMTMVMIGGAGLLARGLERLESQDTGFQSDHLSVFWYSWNVRKDSSLAKMVALGDRVLHRVRAIPGVTAATPMVVPPMLGNGVWQVRYGVDGQTNVDVAANPLFATDMIGPE